jgi:ribulose-phosphate 3-epimerase
VGEPVKRVLIAPSMLACDLVRVGDEVRSVEAAGADLLHFDVMDGVFVPNLSFGPALCGAVAKVSRLPLDVHLMVVDASPLLEPFAAAGAARICVHVEAVTHLHRTLSRIRDLGVSPGVALNPLTPAAAIEEAWTFVDFVLVMSVNPGFGGQLFIPEVAGKLARLAHRRDEHFSHVSLAVDGGVDDGTAELLRRSGADVLVAGTSVFGAADRAHAIAALRGEEER